MTDKLHEFYKDYLLECEDEIGSTRKPISFEEFCSTRRPMSFERFCEFFGVDEHTSDEELV